MADTPEKENLKETDWLKWIGWGVIAIIIILLIAATVIYIKQHLTPPSTSNHLSQSQVTGTTNPSGDNASTTTNAGIAPVIKDGSNIGTNERVLVQAGDVVSGDIQVINSDGTRESLYDDHADTALITIFTQDTWIIGPFGDGVGGYRAKQATQEEIDKLIADKQQSPDNFREIIVKTWPSGSVKTYPGNNTK